MRIDYSVMIFGLFVTVAAPANGQRQASVRQASPPTTTAVPRPLSAGERLNVVRSALRRNDLSGGDLGATARVAPGQLLAPGGKVTLFGVSVGVFPNAAGSAVFRMYKGANFSVVAYPPTAAAAGKPALLDCALEVIGGSAKVNMSWYHYPTGTGTGALGTATHTFAPGLHHATVVPAYPSGQAKGFAVQAHVTYAGATDVLLHYCEVTSLK